MRKNIIFIAIILLANNLFSQENTKSTNLKTDTLTFEITGTIISKNGTSVIIKANYNNKLPLKGQIGKLSKFFEEKIFGINTTGWLDIGKTKIVATKTNVFTLQILEEHSIITKNDKKVDNFKVGATIKFVWEQLK